MSGAILDTTTALRGRPQWRTVRSRGCRHLDANGIESLRRRKERRLHRQLRGWNRSRLPPQKVRWQLNAGGNIRPWWMCCEEAQLDMDNHIAHTQKGGLDYHKLTTQTAAAIAQVQEPCLPKRMTLVGWAFDGFPVYWKYGQLKQGGELITMKSGWKLRKARYAASGGSPMIRSSLSVLLSTTTSTR